MSYQAPDGWQLPVHAPQHGSRPLRLHAHRALRLMAVAGAWAAGLCLVVGSVALVAGAAPPTHVAAAAGVRTLPPARGTASPPPGRVQQVFQGAGDQVTSQFMVAPHSRWELRWSYACTRPGPGGHLQIRESGSDGVTVAASGAAGQGSTWSYTRASAHYLVVIANCGWTIRVTGSR